MHYGSLLILLGATACATSIAKDIQHKDFEDTECLSPVCSKLFNQEHAIYRPVLKTRYGVTIDECY